MRKYSYNQDFTHRKFLSLKEILLIAALCVLIVLISQG